jgi:hypothetical protein
VELCGIDLGWASDHCQLRDACVPGEASSPVGVDSSPDRTMDNGKKCSEASKADIEECLVRNPQNNQPYGAPGMPGNNCQVNASERLGKCCLNANWHPDIGCWVKRKVCMEWETVDNYPSEHVCAPEIGNTTSKRCKRWAYWYSPSPSIPTDPPRCPQLDNETSGGWPRGVVPNPPVKPPSIPWWVPPLIY